MAKVSCSEREEKMEVNNLYENEEELVEMEECEYTLNPFGEEEPIYTLNPFWEPEEETQMEVEEIGNEA